MNYALHPQDPFFAQRRYAWDGRVFPTVSEFELFVQQDAPSVKRWATGITIHHTWRPTVEDWRKNTPANNLKGLVRTWHDTNGWSTGPNMVIGPEGIYLASGIGAPGIHAGICNSDHVGIEIVGNYDNEFWREPIRSFVYGAVTALARVVGTGNIVGHRECHSPKTCPGAAIDMDAFRADIRAQVAGLGYYEVKYSGTLTRTCWSRDCAVVQGHRAGERFLIDEIKIGQEIQGENRWAHRADQLGFIHLGALKKV